MKVNGGVLDAVRGRRSIRRFLPRPVPREMIQGLLEESRWAPSWSNTQPWEIIVVTGEPLERFKKENRQALLAGRTSRPDIPMPIHWPQALQKRHRDSAKSIFDALSIDRDDSEA